MYKKFTIPKGVPEGYARKILLIMRLTTVILIASLMQVSASTFAQKVTLKQNVITLKQVFRELKKQTGYTVIYFHENFDDKKKVIVDFSQAPVDQVMISVLKDLPFNYVIKDKAVIITDKPKSIINRILDVFSTIDVHGSVVDENGNGLSGAVIRVKDGKKTAISDSNGNFTLSGVDENAVLTISYLGFQVQEIKAKKDLGEIKMQEISGQLDSVDIVSTGYQNIPKERATGSFVLIDSALLNRKVSTNILDRLDGVTSGFIFNKNRIGNTPEYSVRGRSTIASNANPLIVLDNFPYDGDISNINPQDVKSITVLKDGAASSIWGSRAGNGVIVITTYKGNFNQKPTISFNSNLTIGDKPDVYYKDQLTNQEYTGIQQYLFDQGAYNTTINNGYGAISPAVEIMLQNRNGTITTQQKTAKLDSIAGHDNRSDLNKYYYRKSANQQYQLSVNGGGQNNKYYISMGYDRNAANTVTNNYDRLTLNANNTISLLKDKLELLTGLTFSSSNTRVNGSIYTPLYPYENIGDQNGRPLAIADNILRLSYVDTVGKGKLLDWHYRPLEELQNSYNSSNTRLTDYRINIGVNYQVIPKLKFSVNYTYDKGLTDYSNNNTIDSYYTRNLINSYSQINSTTGNVTYPIPLGDIVNNNNNSYYSHYGRAQLNYDNIFGKKHAVNMIAGFEVKDLESLYESLTLYGYNKSTANNSNTLVNPTQLYPNFYTSNTSLIPLNIQNVGAIDRYRSFYFNGSYTYNSQYIFSLSARKDESNLFGVKSNQKGVPLWSTGLAWNISNGDFYRLEAIPYLKIRATYGYNGNVNKSISAYLTALSSGLKNVWGQPYITIQNPPNPSLEWEKVKNINVGLDFETKHKIVTGAVEYWIKDGSNLIGSAPIAQQTGVSVFTGNSADMHGSGLDVSLTSKNLSGSNFKWSTSFLFNYNTDKITSYKVKSVNNGTIINSNYIKPVEGYSYYSLFSYKWLGLDNKGNPQGVLNGVLSKDYSAITNSTNINDLVYSGTITPKFYGNLLNTFTWKAFQLSLNISYKFNYVFRRSSINNSTLYSVIPGTSTFQQSDFNKIWRTAGDENTTNVPSLVYPFDGARDAIYSNSSVLVEHGDHIRIQDIRLNYTLSKNKLERTPLSNLQIYSFVSNLGIIWKETKYKVDPDFPTGIPIPRTFALGLKADF